MEGFEHILNWRLLRGSHEFPGKDGGTFFGPQTRELTPRVFGCGADNAIIKSE